jgi:NAD+ kinase
MAASPEEADYLVVIGGDGALLHSIQAYAFAQKPFVGLNAGTRGFLLNDVAEPASSSILALFQSVYVEQLWLLEADVETAHGCERVYGFNDIWVERQGSQTLQMRVSIDGVPQPALIVGDGMLLCTPQGSTGYSRALGGIVILPGVPVLQMTPMACVVDKSPLRSMLFSDASEITLEFEHRAKRPVQLYHDGILFVGGEILRFSTRKSSRSVALGFGDRNGFRCKVFAWLFFTSESL